MALGLELLHKQTQRLALTPKMQQAIQMLQLSTLQLETYLRQELQQNPVLEEMQELEEEAPETDDDSSAPSEETEDGSTDDDLEAVIAEFEDAWSDYYYEGSDFARNPDAEEYRAFAEASITRDQSLSSHLLSQLGLSVEDDEQRRLGEWIIGEIDDRGFFTSSVEEAAAALGVTPEDVEKVLALIQTFDPPGVGARDLRECLLIQSDQRYPGDKELRTLIADHLKLLEKRKLPEIAKAMAITMDRLYELAGLVTTLEPRPGRNFGADNTVYIAPEVVVKKVDDDYVVLVDDDSLPRIRISPYYRRLLAKGKASAEVRRYIKDKYKSAQWLMRNIEQRKSTIYKVTKCIMDLQRDFLERGPEYLKPLTLQQVADMVGMHESTISRVTSNKYVDTPRGIYELKYFFTSGIDTDDGNAQSSTSIRSQIEELIRDDDKKRPLSDQKITDLLNARGLNIARRTVTKYRESLGILSSKLRREY